MLDCALRVRRVRLAIEMVKTVGEYFGEGRPKERMDCFLNFLFLFFYDTKESWTPELTEEFGEFPHDVVHELQKLLATFRRKDKSKFPDSLEKAREAVARIQAKYRDKANLLYQQTGQLTQPDIEQEELPRKGKGHKDDEDEDAERAPTPQLEANGDVETAKEVEDRASPLTVDFHDNEHKFSVDEDFDVTMQHEADPEDDDLLRDIERAMNETYQAASVVQKQTNIDLEVPPSARQKFERKITFAEETKNRAEVVEEPEAPRVQMALMTRKGNRKVLKAVNVAPSQGMHEALLEMRAQNERERKELKALTLAMDERIANQQHPELNTNNTPLNQPLPRPSNVSPPHPQIPAGPQRPAPYGRFASTSRDSGT
ncbi:hypothetical protein M3Y99_00858700 [Aphelenchoides fujianensis]|nr:hypothetical protein M3Y99_00858700 [Aphelenchoides fujianensis]